MGVDFAAEGLLDGLDGEARAARLELLERLHDEGARGRVGDEQTLRAIRLLGAGWRRPPGACAIGLEPRVTEAGAARADGERS